MQVLSATPSKAGSQRSQLKSAHHTARKENIFASPRVDLPSNDRYKSNRSQRNTNSQMGGSVRQSMDLDQKSIANTVGQRSIRSAMKGGERNS